VNLCIYERLHSSAKFNQISEMISFNANHQSMLSCGPLCQMSGLVCGHQLGCEVSECPLRVNERNRSRGKRCAQGGAWD
jgi:hypothetical protein